MSDVKFINVKKSYGPVDIIPGFNLQIGDGEFVSFLGPSGCGKTTCLRMVAGLEQNNSGQIVIGDQIVSDPENNAFVPPEKRKLGMVFQSYAVWPHLDVFENVAFPLRMSKVPSVEREARVKEILAIVELDGLEKRMPHQLSGGQQQRVALARGLVARPRVLLLDEPLSNLDAKLREKMRADIRKIQQQFKLTCIYVTHDQIEAFSMSDRLVVMNKGVIQQVGTPAAVRAGPANEFVKDFVN